MTNILAAIIVCIVTNVVEWDNGFTIPQTTQIYFGSGESATQPPYSQPATEKTETTTIKEVKTLIFKWGGQEWSIKKERVLSTKTRKWKKDEKWVEE